MLMHSYIQTDYMYRNKSQILVIRKTRAREGMVFSTARCLICIILNPIAKVIRPPTAWKFDSMVEGMLFRKKTAKR